MGGRPGGAAQVGPPRWGRPGGAAQVGPPRWGRPGGAAQVGPPRWGRPGGAAWYMVSMSLACTISVHPERSRRVLGTIYQSPEFPPLGPMGPSTGSGRTECGGTTTRQIH